MKKIFLFISLFVAIASIITFASGNYANAAAVPTDTGRVTISTPLTGGTYKIWSRMKASNAGNSFFLQVDNQTPILIGDSTSIFPASKTDHTARATPATMRGKPITTPIHGAAKSCGLSTNCRIAPTIKPRRYWAGIGTLPHFHFIVWTLPLAI